MKYFAGIDQGGSKCDVLIGNEHGDIIDRYVDAGYSAFLDQIKTGEIKSNEEFYIKCIGQQVNYLNLLLERNQ